MFSVGDKKGPGGWPAWADRECAILDRVATVLLRLQGWETRIMQCQVIVKCNWEKLKTFIAHLLLCFSFHIKISSEKYSKILNIKPQCKTKEKMTL